MSKYYTPKIEEFYVGFECEAFINNKMFLPLTMNGVGQDVIQYHNNNVYRVKYLDRTDIESLGFIAKYKDREKENMYYMDPAISLWFVEHMSLIRLVAPNGRNFTGTIKNKSELKKLLIQLSILEDGE